MQVSVGSTAVAHGATRISRFLSLTLWQMMMFSYLSANMSPNRFAAPSSGKAIFTLSRSGSDAIRSSRRLTQVPRRIRTVSLK